MTNSVPFNKSFIGSEEIEAVARAMGQSTLRGNGPIGLRVEQTLREWLGVRHVLLATSCTHALEMALITLRIGPGHEVILPSFTFVSTANAVVHLGGTPVFADIHPHTLNLDPEDVARRITPKTRAIIPVHYAGVGCEMDAIMDLARSHELHVVEDAAHAIDAKYRGRYLGTIGDVGCFSFHDTKNITCGEGGAFLTNSDELAHCAELVREKGTNRSAFARGAVDKYTWTSRGSSYVQSDILAAILEAQVAKREMIKTSRKRVWHAYYDALQPLEEQGLLSLPEIPEYCEQNYHLFYFRVQTESLRDDLLRGFRQRGIEATFHYVPLHSSPFGQRYARPDLPLPWTERCSKTLIRLPLYPQLVDIIDELAAEVAAFLAHRLNFHSTPYPAFSPVSLRCPD